MPLKYDKFEPKDDLRRKVMPEQHDEIKKLYEQGLTQTTIARQYGVSRHLIALIVKPERAAAVKARIKEHWKDYSDREELTKAAQKMRKRKREMGLSRKR